MAVNLQINTNTSLESAYLTDEIGLFGIKTSSFKNIWFNENMSSTFSGCKSLNYDFLNSRFSFNYVKNMQNTF